MIVGLQTLMFTASKPYIFYLHSLKPNLERLEYALPF